MINQETREEPVKGQSGAPQLDVGSSPEVMNMREAAKFLSISSRTLDRYVRNSVYSIAQTWGARANPTGYSIYTLRQASRRS